MKMKAILTVGVITLFLGSAIAPVIAPMDLEKPLAKINVEVVNDHDLIIHIDAQSDYEYGLKEGKIFHDRYHLIADKFWKLMEGKGMTREMVRKKAGEHRQLLEEYYPSFLQRLEGVSSATGLSLMNVVAMEMYLPSLIMKRDACTTTAVGPLATKDGQTFISWNVDQAYDWKLILSWYALPLPLIICDIPGKYKYVKFGILPSIFGFGLLNEKGLAYGANQVTVEDKGDGLTSLELNNLAMESCATVKEVANLYSNATRQSADDTLETLYGLTSNMNTVWADSEGKILCIEYTHNYIATAYGIKGILAEANHHQWLDPNLTGAPKPGDSFSADGSYCRAERAFDLLEEYYGSIDVDFYKKVLTCDHGSGIVKDKPDYWDICRHCFYTPNFPWDVLSLKYFAGTNCAIVTQPTTLTIYYCPGHPCIAPFKTLNFEEEFQG
jgi:hypothetical protein